MNLSPQWLRLVILIGTCLFLNLCYLDSLWSGSADTALHDTLIARITEFGQLPTTFDLTWDLWIPILGTPTS
jgi:hypothetical protein